MTTLQDTKIIIPVIVARNDRLGRQVWQGSIILSDPVMFWLLAIIAVLLQRSAAGQQMVAGIVAEFAAGWVWLVGLVAGPVWAGAVV